ncbi:phenol hydroxylase subunit [Aquabacterium sp. OR-4]|uniref:phenol hydroxylase subunit n=1 Tax=Aquabacterium sp. OR-4 TaxID=2978127 RepID=UPI0021B4393E|nr:phenol hydroxylase subunit [Aquabacterium sp. OR-4]MDT7837044.1 phenol hydroxylase subunit [Aquabacterium sp. OR-4]
MPMPDFAATAAPAAPAAPDPSQRWVRITRDRPDGFVEFDFAIGTPDLAVDLILPRPAFEAFCAEQQVRRIGDAQAAALAAEQAQWRHGRPGLAE